MFAWASKASKAERAQKEEALRDAATEGNLTNVRYYLKKGVNVNCKSALGYTALCFAASNGHVEIVRLLLEKGAANNAKHKYAWTPLHEAAEKGHLDIARLLLTKGTAIGANDYDGRTPLHKAAIGGHLEIVRLLLAKGAAIDVKDEGGSAPLHKAAECGRLDVVRLLLEKGAVIDAKDYDGRTPLCSAAHSKHLDIVHLLLEKGAAIDATDKFGYTSLHKAAEKGHSEVVRFLLAKGAAIDMRSNDGSTPLHRAADAHHFDVVRLLLEKGAAFDVKDSRWATLLYYALVEQMFIDPKFCSSNGSSLVQLVLATQDIPLLQELVNQPKLNLNETTRALAQTSDAVKTLFLHAASTNDASVVEKLLSLGIRPTYTNEHGETALHVAAARGHGAVVTCLLDFANDEAYVNTINHAGESALFVAAAHGRAFVVKSLLGAHASPHCVAKNGRTLLHAAVISGDASILDHLLTLCSKAVDACDALGQTALHLAAANGHASAVQLLVDAKASVFATTSAGETPRMLAKELGVIAFLEMVEHRVKDELLETIEKHTYDPMLTLLAHGIDPNTTNEAGDSLLHLAVRGNNPKALDALLKVPGIRMDVRNLAGVTPLLLAVRDGCRHLAKMLHKAKHSVLPDVPASAIEIDTSRVLGAGSFGVVYRGTYNGRSVAVKTPAKASCIPDLIDEMETMQRCNSPFVLQLLAVSGASTSSPKLVLEYMDAGDLRSYLDAKRLGQPTKVNVSTLEVAWVVANALADLHEAGLLHRDLKSENVLLCSENYIKLADLGIARECKSKMTTGKGTPYWTAPEVYTSGSNYSFAADIYAFGVILSELDTLLLPYADVPGINFWGIMDRVRNGTLRPSLTPTCAPWLKELATACFASDPAQRPTAHDVVNVLERQLNHANSEMPPTLLRREPSAPTPLIAQVAPVSRQQDSSLGSSAPLSASHLLSRIPEVELTPHESPPESGNAKTDAGGSIEKVVANDLICQRCTATNSFLDDACETCHESLPPSSQRLALFVERLEVAAAQGLRVESTIPCHTCSTAYPMTTAECDDCGDAFPADTVKIRMLLKRLELARSSNPIV